MKLLYKGVHTEHTTATPLILKYQLNDLDILIGEDIYQGIRLYQNPFKYFTIEFEFGQWTMDYNPKVSNLFLDEIQDLSKKLQDALFLMNTLEKHPNLIKDRQSYEEV